LTTPLDLPPPNSRRRTVLDLIGVIFMLFMGASIVIVVGALAIWIGETTYKRKKTKGKVW
jgi:uncharacterized membrane protein YqiK